MSVVSGSSAVVHEIIQFIFTQDKSYHFSSVGNDNRKKEFTMTEYLYFSCIGRKTSNGM